MSESELVGRDADAEALETAGAECEARLPYAGSHQPLRSPRVPSRP